MELLSAKVAAVETPSDVKRRGEAAVAAYRADLREQAKVIQTKAAEQYQAARLNYEAARAGTENEWTRRARESLWVSRVFAASRCPSSSPIGDFPHE